MLKTQSIMLALTLLCCSSAVQAQRGWPYPPAFEDADEHVYRTVGDVTLKAWVFRPESVAPAGGYPAIVFFFGGGWQGGTPAQFAKQCRYFQSRGMVAVACDYRVASRHGVKAVDCVEDAKSAVRWLRASAAGLQIDPQRICASGGSAGGHIAACTGVVSGLDANGEDLAISSVPNAMALFNPAVMLAPLEGAELTAKQAERN